MPRRGRFCPVGCPIHVIQRGINRQTCFAADADIAAYAHWLAEGAQKFDVHIHGWVFMTNHVHLLLTPQHDKAVSRLMQFLGRLYVRHFNYNYVRSGSLFEDRFKSSLVQDDIYLLACLRYIELNPVRAGMVTDPDHRYRRYTYRRDLRRGADKLVPGFRGNAGDFHRNRLGTTGIPDAGGGLWLGPPVITFGSRARAGSWTIDHPHGSGRGQ